MSDAIQVEGLVKKYGRHAVLRGIDLHIRQGEIFALLGVNGAGKTTALECIEGMRNYDSGRITIEGKIGIQLQSSSLPAHIKSKEAVTLFAKWNRTKIDNDMLTALGLDEIWERQYESMSTGQKRRLHLALALAGRPDILFLDEPTAGLDVEGRQSLHGQIRKWKEDGKTIVLATHDMAEVEALCDRIAILSGGNIIFCGTADELTDRISRRFTVQIRTGRGTESVETDNVADTLLMLLEDIKERQEQIFDIKIDRGTLEEHFLELTGGV